MDAAIFYGQNNIQIENLPRIKKNDHNHVLKVLSCSICSYDVRTFRTENFKVIPPIILGHEICAQIIDTYTEKNCALYPGTRVSIYPIIPCLNCWYCTNKKYNLCNNKKELGSSIDGGFAEYISIPKSIFEICGIVPVPDCITNEEASLIEPLACCINSISLIKETIFDSVIILGDGPIGIMQLMLIKKLYKTKVTMIGKIPQRLDLAKKLGANLTICLQNPEECNENLLKELIKDIDIECSPNIIFISNNDPLSFKLSLNLVNKNGKIISFSGIKNNKGSNEISNFFLNLIHYNQISVIGSFSSTPKDMITARKMLELKEIDLKYLISNKFSLFDIQNAFLTSESYLGFKSIINKF